MPADKTTEKTPSLAAKLAAVMGAVGSIPKKGRNEHFKYDFVQEEDVSEALRGELSKRNVIVVPSARSRERAAGSNITILEVELTFYDGDSDATIKLTVFGEGQDTQDKGSNKALTAAVKYGLLKTFLISSGDDPDRAGATTAASSTTRPSSPPAAPSAAKPNGERKSGYVDTAATKDPLTASTKKAPIDGMALDTLIAAGRGAPAKVRDYFYETWLPQRGYKAADRTELWNLFTKTGLPHYAEAVAYFEQNVAAGAEGGS